MQAAILVGGRGTRLGALTDGTPKPMLPVAGKPMLEHLIASLARQGVTQVIMLAGYLGEQLAALASRSDALGVDIVCRIEPTPAGTGGALLQARDILHPDFLLLNGDSFFDVDIADLARAGQASGAMGALALRAVEDLSRYGSVSLDADRVTGFAEKRPGAGLMNGGVYWLRRPVLDYVATLPCSIERDVFPVLAAKGELIARTYDGYFIDIGVPEDFKRAQSELPEALSRAAGPGGQRPG